LDRSGRPRPALANSDHHRVRANQVLDARLAEAGFLHPALAVGAGVVEPAGFSISMLMLIIRPNAFFERSSSMMLS
jgi:hypothetical protein